MTLKPLALILVLGLSCAGCSRFDEALTVGLAGPPAAAFEDAGEAAFLEPEPDPEARAGRRPGGRGIEPHLALRSSELARARWAMQRPSLLETMPMRAEVGAKEMALGPAVDADAAMRRIERGSRAGMGSICRGC